MQISIATTLRDAMRMFRQFGFGLCLEYLAAMVIISLLLMIVAPERTTGLLANTDAAFSPDGFYFVYLLLSSGTFAIIFASQVLRLWQVETRGVSDPVEVWGRIRAMLVPLIVIQFGVDLAIILSILMFFVLAIFVAAVTTLIIPVLVIEQRSWQSLGRNMELVRDNIVRLAGVWAIVTVPFIVVTVILATYATPSAEISGLGIVFGDALASVPTAVINGMSACIATSVYLRLTSPDDKLPDIFR